MKFLRWTIIVPAVTVMLLASLSLNTAAQEKSTPGGVTISPSLKELIIGPGLLEAKTTVDVRNDTGKDLVAQLRLVDFDALDEFGGVSLGQIDAPLTEYSLAKWM